MTVPRTEPFPAEWHNVRFKYLADVRKGRLPTTAEPSSGNALPYLSMEYLRGQTVEPSLAVASGDSVVAEDGDSLLLWDGANAGEFLRARRGIVSSTAALVSPREVDGEFLYWTCKGHERFVRAETVGMGIPHVSGEFLDNLVLRVPPISTQKAIGDYLSHETARIDELIAEKEKMLKLLEEKRTALISHVVAHGIEPDVEMRPSGVDWLSEIPAHWETHRAKALFSVRDDRSEDGMEELLTVSHLTGVTSRADKDVNMFKSESLVGYKKCITGDLAINTLWAWMGAMGVVRQEGIVSPDYHVYCPAPALVPDYIELLCRSKPFVAEVNRHSKGVWSSRLRLYPEAFFQIVLPVPPQSEQRQIVEQLEAEISKTHDLKVTLNDSIRLLSERRAAVIAAAVTGRLDVAEMNQ